LIGGCAVADADAGVVARIEHGIKGQVGIVTTLLRIVRA
jgi:hypothetical protein